MYGRPLVREARPGTVTAAAWITLIMAGLTGALFGFITLGMLVAKDDVVTEMDKAFAEQGVTGDFSAEDAYGFFLFALVVLTLWCIIACVLAVFAMRGSNVSRILLVISSVVAGLLSLVAIGSVITAVWLLACLGRRHPVLHRRRRRVVPAAPRLLTLSRRRGPHRPAG